ncbi:MAG: phosphoribosylanthranilate isomerase [Bacteroidales bacterium]|nr:phosphoribosylanthranilate isomerase [Bacteroidales bacterium]
MTSTGIKLKICGMRECENISEVSALKPDYMGFIFYLKSPRFVGSLDEGIVQYVKSNGIEPVAVFVNATLDTMIQLAELYGFTHVQLHGKETPDTCAALKAKGMKVIKAFNIAGLSDLQITKAYEETCDFFLFDTKTEHPGGSGRSFDWDLLNAYSAAVPFFLSGGIGPDDAEKVRSFHHPMLFGIDLNSRFEIQPALKDVHLLKIMVNQLTSQK